ncbi:MAG: hypothetical protein JO031_05935, partial [Ktedonobacteraceae bacterium]|nr:hypothetical protein [Ktedonobacteraceae bacterium]
MQEEKTGLSNKKVRKDFYQRFQLEHNSFRLAIQGISSEDEQHIYAKLMLRRLMVLYFLQEKGLLDNDTSYLTNSLRSMQDRQGEDLFYRSHLLPLFHQYLCNSTKTSNKATFIGNIPALA